MYVEQERRLSAGALVRKTWFTEQKIKKALAALKAEGLIAASEERNESLLSFCPSDDVI